MMRFGLTLIAATAVLLLAPVAHAEDDRQAWAAVTASGAVKGDLFVWLEAQARITDDVGGGTQLLVRPAIGARIGRDAHAVFGYAHVRTDPETGAATSENRLWQQVQFVPLRHAGGAPLLVSRTRLEQRRLVGRDDTGWRLRQFVRAQAPIAGSKVLAVAYTEGFVNLAETSWGSRKGVDQWRNFVGVGLPITPRMRLEPGYLNQRVFRRGDDRTNHILNAALFITLP
ncbi:DUF2490 domain-containing protein [Sphingomonas aracearum]|uniref:DUF2490 domain-containing protein n=1 Tax=Sphingomonas aracearum TaxID=2283317 RepID=A0A369VRL3_9SPHN|nr:DUF2490 domain-containing protein [Sphingomonas aracearum]RDE04519.1 DUF2490 domain-containing protein [Sphingomonas aracearum]